MSPRWKIPGISRIAGPSARVRFSAFGGYLAMIGFFLYAVAYLKGAQVLMFVPALFLGVLAFSFFETRRIAKGIRFTWTPYRGWYRLFAKLPDRSNVSFRVLYEYPDRSSEFPEPRSVDASFPIPDRGCEAVVMARGTFDLFRIVRHVGKAEPIPESHGSDAGLPYDAFQSVRPYREGEFLGKLDTVRSSMADRPFVRVWETLSDASRNASESSARRLSVRSNVPIAVAEPLADAPGIQWRLIALCSLVIAVQWENWWFLAQIAGAFLLLSFLRRTVPPERSGRNFRTLLTFVAFAVMLYSSAILLDMTGPVSVFLMEILLIAKFFPNRRDESFLFVFLCTFVFATVSFLSFQVWFVGFFVLLLFGLVKLLSETSGYFGKESLFSQIRTKPAKGYFASATALLFTATVVFFLILPHGDRSGNLSVIPNLGEVAETVAGYSGELSLSDVGAVMKDPLRKIVVRNITPEISAKLRDAYWRGERFSSFVAWRWVLAGDDTALRALRPNADGVKLRISYADIGTRTLLFPWVPVSAYFENDRSWVAMARSDDPTLFRSNVPIRQGSEIVATFATSLTAPPPKENFRNPKPLSKDVETLFAQYWDSIPSSVAKTPDSLTRYVRSGFAYSADVPAKDLPSFLYSEKRGHCEYFATVLALTLRHYGFPTTVVTGFRGGEESLFGKTWIVRGSDAHAWVEVWQDGIGWKVYDPTPYDASSEASVISQLRSEFVSAYDTLDLLWFSYAVGYGSDAQKAFLSESLRYLPWLAFLPIVTLFSLAYRRIRKSYSERRASWEGRRLVDRLSSVTASKFPLSVLESEYPDLVGKTRASVYGVTRSSASEIRRLSREWDAALKGKGRPRNAKMAPNGKSRSES